MEVEDIQDWRQHRRIFLPEVSRSAECRWFARWEAAGDTPWGAPERVKPSQRVGTKDQCPIPSLSHALNILESRIISVPLEREWEGKPYLPPNVPKYKLFLCMRGLETHGIVSRHIVWREGSRVEEGGRGKKEKRKRNKGKGKGKEHNRKGKHRKLENWKW